MPCCILTQKFIESLKKQKPPQKYIHYRDEDIPGFVLEYRHTGKGTWYFQYRDAAKKLRLFRLGTLAELLPAEARMQAYSLHQLVKRGGDPHQGFAARADTLTMEQFVTEYYLPHIKIKKRSWSLDQRILRLHVLPLLGMRCMQHIQHIDIVSLQDAMKSRGLAAGTCNRVLIVLKSLFNAAVRWGLLAAGTNVCSGVQFFAETKMRERYLSPQEARNLLQFLRNCKGLLSAQAIQLLLFTGARKSEILMARWEYVDMERCLLTVPLSKSGKTRHIPLSNAAIAVLKSIPRYDDQGWVFFNPSTGSHLSSVFTFWRRLRKELGLEDFRLHDLRHSFASFLVNSGCSLYEVQECLGHQTPRMTMRYAHLASESLVNAANAVETCIGTEM